MRTDEIVAIGAILLLLVGAGGLLGLIGRKGFSAGWLLVAAALVAIDDALLTRGYGLLPRLLPPSGWNWQGKLLALLATLLIAALPAFGWRRVGLVLKQHKQGRTLTYAVAVLLCAIFVYFALRTPNEPLHRGTLAFQLTMPGLEEEPYYRGTLLFALNQAFRGRVRLLGAEMGWGGLLSSVLFGLAHAFGYEHGAFSLDWTVLALTGGPALLLVWLRERTGSLVLPILLHNFGNTIGLLV